MNKFIYLILVSFLVQSIRAAVIEDDFEPLNETSEIHDSGLKACNGPGSDQYNNLVFNGRCNCKKNVRGKFCTACKRNSFDLSAHHRHGCLRCFCSGLSSVCEPSHWFREKIDLVIKNDSHGIELVQRDLTSVDMPLKVDEELQKIYVEDVPSTTENNYYWKLPQSFAGDRLTAYGGFLNFTIDYKTHPIPKGKRKWVKEPLAIIRGYNITIYYRFRKRYRRIASHILPLVEQSWFKVEDKSVRPVEVEIKEVKRNGKKKKERKKRKRVRRKDFMTVLSDVEYILLKANYRARVKMISLQSVSMSHAVESGNESEAITSAVEKCTCPVGYGGLSCQRCITGFTKNLIDVQKKRQAANLCVPCQCNGHSDTCDHISGKCMDCKHNTRGDHCQYSLLECDPRGTLELIVLPNEPSRCLCKVRVQGDLCDSCKLGYFNLVSGNEMGCTKCWCNGVTFSCSSSRLRRFQIRIQLPAFINFVAFHSDGMKYTRANDINNGKAVFKFKRGHAFYNPHWSLPKIFTGNLLKSYGGNLNFTTYHYAIEECHGQLQTLLELESFDGIILRWKFTPPTLTNKVLTTSVKMMEDSFEYMGQKPGRIMFLEVLSAVKSIRIYVPECTYLKVTEIEAIYLDTAVGYASEHPFASEVEECQCPPEYSGLSCENCSPGYVKDATRKRCVKKTF